MSDRSTEPRTEAPAEAHAPRPAGWGPSILTAIVMIVACFLVLVFIPNQLTSYLSLHTAPNNRDLAVVVWWGAGFLFCCWLFVRLQRGGSR